MQTLEGGRAPGRDEPVAGGSRPGWAVIGIFLILALGVLFVGRDFLMPLTLAFLLALVFSPIVRFLARRRVPYALSAALLVSLFVFALVAAVYSLGGPLGDSIDRLPSSVASVERKLAGIIPPVRKVIDASERVDDLGQPPGEPETEEVVVKEKTLVVRAVTGAPWVLAKAVFVLALLLFLLASGNLFYEKAVHALPTLADKKRALTIAYSVERELSRYLFTITWINVGLGCAIGIAMWLAGMPNPVLWGTIAAVFNFVPYLGALAGVTLSGIVALVTFESLGEALIAPALYLTLTTVEGHFITPAVVGRRLEMNSVAVLLSLAFWAWMWGVFGALMAVPILVAVRVLSEHIPPLAGLGLFLASQGATLDSGHRRTADVGGARSAKEGGG